MFHLFPEELKYGHPPTELRYINRFEPSDELLGVEACLCLCHQNAPKQCQ